MVREEGSHTLEYRSLDMAYNVETVQSRSLRIDRTPPQPAAPILDGNQLANGWYNTPVTLRLQAEDQLSGLAGLERQDAAGNWQATAAVTPLSQTGQHAITWRAVDRAGNPSAKQEVSILLDLTPPTTTHTLTPTATGDWFNQPVSVTLAATDQGPGLFATHFRWENESSWRTYAGPIQLTEEGIHTLAYYSSDRALNLEQPHTVEIALDRTPPALTYTVNGVYPPPTWVRTSATLVVTATDALAGVTQVAAAFAGGDWQAYATPLLVNTPGQHQLNLQARDAAGNRVATTAQLDIDATPPQSTLLLDGGRGPNGWFVTLTLSAVDSESGVVERQFRLN